MCLVNQLLTAEVKTAASAATAVEGSGNSFHGNVMSTRPVSGAVVCWKGYMLWSSIPSEDADALMLLTGRWAESGLQAYDPYLSLIKQIKSNQVTHHPLWMMSA
jgi:hypothetical protein